MAAGPVRHPLSCQPGSTTTKGTNEMTKPTRDVTLRLDDVIARTDRGYMFIDPDDGAVVVQIPGIDELVEVDADTACRFLCPEDAQQLIQSIAESLDSELNE
jgi:hypothetical protein